MILRIFSLFVSIAILAMPVWAKPAPNAGNAIAVRPTDFDQVMGLIRARVNISALPKFKSQVIATDQNLAFVSRQPLLVKEPLAKGDPKQEGDDDFSVRTVFLLKSPTIVKRVFINQGRDNMMFDKAARLRFKLQQDGEVFENFLYNGLGSPMQVYNRGQDMFIYMQAPAAGGTVDVKEWIWARQPNCPQGSRYVWKVQSEEFFRRLALVPSDKAGAVDLRRQVVIKEIDFKDYDAQRHIIDVIHQAMNGIKFHISGEDLLGQIQPVYYVTSEGRRKQADFRINGTDELVIAIHEPPQSYPVLIESN